MHQGRGRRRTPTGASSALVGVGALGAAILGLLQGSVCMLARAVLLLVQDHPACERAHGAAPSGRRRCGSHSPAMAPPIPRAATAPLLYCSSGSSSPRSSKSSSSSSALPIHWRRPAAADAAPLLGTRRGILAAAAAYTLLLVMGLGLLYSGLHRQRASASPAADGVDALAPAALEQALLRQSAVERAAAAELWPPSAAGTPNVEFNDAGGLGKRVANIAKYNKESSWATWCALPLKRSAGAYCPVCRQCGVPARRPERLTLCLPAPVPPQ